MAKRSKSSQRWLNEHERDPFVRSARSAGYRSRAAYKLLEIDAKYRLLAAGQRILDLGAAPGGWSQVAARVVGPQGLVIAVDLLETRPIDGVTIVSGDFMEPATLAEITQNLNGSPLDLVISDMAPNLSGVKDIDLPRSVELVELALEVAVDHLRSGGGLLAKAFEGEGIEPLRATFRRYFRKLHNVKPAASRGRSREIYLLGTGFLGG